MKIKLLRPTVIRDFPGVQPGIPFDCPPATASVLIGVGRAVEVFDAPSKPTPESIETRTPEVENRDPAHALRPVKRVKGKLV